MTPLEPHIPRDAPDGSELDAHLLALRARLREAREERGGCPPWVELRADLVPGGRQRSGRAERQAHVALCPYCSTHVLDWKKSEDYAADRLEALERGVVRGLAGGAKGLLRTLGRALPGRPRSAGSLRADEAPLPPAIEAAPARLPVSYQAPSAGAPQPAASLEAHAAMPRVLVVEMADGRTPPESLFLCARVLDAEVAQVDSVDELVGDPDLALVCGVVLGGLRAPESWPEMVRHARAIVKGRPVLLLAHYGAEPTAGARRALGDALLNEADPAEHLLLALDARLR
ncbi:MAG: hypothetical protein ABI960_07070 [Candidatus Eisenbacteria bacterium]